VGEVTLILGAHAGELFKVEVERVGDGDCEAGDLVDADWIGVGAEVVVLAGLLIIVLTIRKMPAIIPTIMPPSAVTTAAW
jgi:hypothetical protein